MTWPPLLLTDESPSLRFLVLKKLLKIDDEETKELEKERLSDPLVTELIKLQNHDGSWGKGTLPGNTSTSKTQLTSQALTRLGSIGFNSDFEPVRKGAEYLFKQQKEDGSWPLGSYSTDSEGRENYDTMSLQTSIPLRGLAECQYGTCKKAEKAYEWLLNQRLDDGAWPTGIAHGNYGYVAGYRRLPHSRWGCRSNTVSALICLSLHPHRCKVDESRKALDLLLGTESSERQYLGYYVARTMGYEPSGGFLTYYARNDVAQTIKLCSRIGASTSDSRVAELLELIDSFRGQYGLWEYLPVPQASRWVTYDLSLSLSGLDQETDWLSLQPRTPFQTYPKKRRRY